jgi:hypothetical protein
LALILHGVNGTGCDPVDLIREVGGIEELDGSILGWHNQSTEESLVLRIGHGGEFIVTNGERGLRRVDLMDLGCLLDKDILSELVFLLGSEGESKFSNMLNESLFDLN